MLPYFAQVFTGVRTRVELILRVRFFFTIFFYFQWEKSLEKISETKIIAQNPIKHMLN